MIPVPVNTRVWPSVKEGKIAQLAMLLEGIDWRLPQSSWKLLKAG